MGDLYTRASLLVSHLLSGGRNPPPTTYAGLVDWSQPTLYISAASIIFNPTFWNIAARQEYHNKVISSLFGGPYRGCYALAATIFSLGILRDYLYVQALENQPISPLLAGSSFTTPVAYSLLAYGNLLVLTSMWALGVTGTYLGDYFGILMDKMVTGFPFNVTGSPMYWGSLCSFIGTALHYNRPAGLVLSVLVYLCYRVALAFEDPFTAEIYAKRDREQKKGKKRS